MPWMSQASLYDVLLVAQNASVDEIKLAFKKRALQVHPDKGGSKEAFHLVYQALETLVDPEARKKYDHALTVKQPQRARRRKKADRKQRHSQDAHGKPEKQPKSKPKPKATSSGPGSGKETAAPAGPQSKQTKLLTHIRDLLKQLPRNVRSDVITKLFTQKQRLILEKWMVDSSSTSLALAATSEDSAIENLRDLPDSGSCRSVVVCSPATKNSSSVKFRKETKKQNPNRKKRSTNGSGYIRKNHGSSYTPTICFDAVEVCARSCDLQTALEYLVVLTAVSQKMRASINGGAAFEERLHAAVMSSANEHGKLLQDLKLAFSIVHAAAVFCGSELRTPYVRSIEQLGQMRSHLDPFRQRMSPRKKSIFWQYSPVHFQDAWERFQQAAGDAWEIAGADRQVILRKIRAGHKSRAEFRTAQLEQWERGHLAIFVLLWFMVSIGRPCLAHAGNQNKI